MMNNRYLWMFAGFILAVLVIIPNLIDAQVTPEATPSIDIIVVPDDDPTAARCEIEIIAESHEVSGLYRVLARISTPLTFSSTGNGQTYANNCMLIGFQKLGYTLWSHARIESILKDDDGDYYAWAIFNDIE